MFWIARTESAFCRTWRPPRIWRPCPATSISIRSEPAWPPTRGTMKWSSCRCFVGTAAAPSWLELQRILGGFSSTRKTAQRRYAAYLAEASVTNPCAEAVAGSILGTQPFLRWVEDTFLSARPADPEIPGLKRVKPAPAVEAIVQAVAAAQQVRGEQILARGSQPNLARDIAMYLCRELSGQSCRELGHRFGGVSGAAVTMRHQALGRRMRNDRSLAQTVARLREKIVSSQRLGRDPVSSWASNMVV